MMNIVAFAFDGIIRVFGHEIFMRNEPIVAD